MKAWLLAVWVTFTLSAADERQLALSLKAQSDFERVQLSPRAALADAETCQQSQAASLSVSLPEELSLLHFRKGWCALAAATLTGNQKQFADAVTEFDQAVAAWPSRMRKSPKNAPPEPVSDGLRVLAAIARLQTGTEPGPTLADILRSPSCNSNLMSAEFCGQILKTGSLWLGWLALRDGRLDEAARVLSGSTDSGWSQWVQGRRSFEAGSYPQAVTSYASAIGIWRAEWGQPTLLRALGPHPSVPVALTDLGGAQLLAGDLQGSIRTLDSAIKADDHQARALFLRARAKELSGKGDAALADYNLASRTAFASAPDLASGEAHLYRGILMYRRKDYERAEDEFSTALNFEITPALRADASAWRHLAAVAAGGCTSARASLEASMARVSPFFPKTEARSLAAACVLNSRAL
jgi:tetratricopeptide (TPR) repeat protein